jgi:hypothetical protein
MRWVVAIALLAGVARAEDKTVPAADVEKYLAFFDRLVEVVVADGKDCDKMAIDVAAHVDQNQALVDRANQAKRDGFALPQDAADHIRAGVKKMYPGIAACGGKPQVRAAFDKLGK